MKFSVVIPVHNEENVLRITLPSIFNLDAAEFIFVLDRCTDGTKRLVKKYDKVKTVEVSEKSDWGNHLNFLYDLGIRQAKAEIVFLSQADVIPDFQLINKTIHKAEEAMVSYGVLQHIHCSPWNSMVNQVLQYVSRVTGIKGFSGTFAFPRKVYPSQLRLTRELTVNFDSYIFKRWKQFKLPYFYFPSKSVNIRPCLKMAFRFTRRQYELGVAKYKFGKSLLKVALFSYIRFTPSVLVGYLKAKVRGEPKLEQSGY